MNIKRQNSQLAGLENVELWAFKVIILLKQRT